MGGLLELFLFSYSFVTIREQKQRKSSGRGRKFYVCVRSPQSLELFNFPVRFHDEATTSDSGSDGDSVDDAGPGANEFDDYAEEDDHDDKEGSRQEGPGGERDGSTDSGAA